MKTAISCRSTATAVLRLWASQVDGMVQLQVLREYRYDSLAENRRGQRVKHRVHRLRTATLALPLDDPALWGPIWYELFDLASAMASTEPRRRVWVVQPLMSLQPYAEGAVQMLARSVAMELGFEVAESGVSG